MADPRSSARQDFLPSSEVLTSEAAADITNVEPVKNEPYSVRDDGHFVCNVCGKVYKQMGSLKKHINTNHKLGDIVSFLCKKCNKLFDTKKKLTRHESNKKDCSLT